MYVCRVFSFYGHTCGICKFPGWGSNQASIAHFMSVRIIHVVILVYFFFFVFFFFPPRAAPAAYESSQARGQIGATAAGLHHSHSNARSELLLWPTPQLTATMDPQPLRKARDWTRALKGTSPVRYCWAMMGTPSFLLLKSIPWNE